MKISEIRRYPIKSLLGERPTTVEVDRRGLAGDRLWAVRDDDGKLGSGKNTRRFRRMPGLFMLRGHCGDGAGVPVVELPDGRRFAADDPAGHRGVSDVLGRRVTRLGDRRTARPHRAARPGRGLTVQPERQSQGIGSTIVRAAALYLRLGYRETGCHYLDRYPYRYN